jgi:hypothetical protein
MKTRYAFLLTSYVVYLYSCSPKPGDLVSPQIDQSIKAADVKVNVTANNIPADGYSNAEITVDLTDTSLVLPGTNISFTSNNGTFTNGTISYSVPSGNNGMTEAYLKCNQAGVVNVTATVSSSFSETVAVTFVPALPDQVTLAPDIPTLTYSTAPQANLTTTLSRLLGTPSTGQALTYSDSTAIGGKSVGIFVNTTLSNASGVATAQYLLQDSTYTGFVYLKASIGSTNKTISGTTRLLIK